MPDPALGANSRVVLDFETAWGTAKGSPDGKSVAFTQSTLGAAQELIDNPALRGDLNPIDPVFGKKSASGSLVIVPTLAVMPFLTKWITGVLTTTGAADPFAHASKLNATMPASAVVETKIDVGGTLRYIKGTGVRVNRLSLPISFEGLNTISLDVLAKDVTVETTEYDSTPLDWASGAPLDNMSLQSADVKIGGSAVGYIQSGNLEINANLYGDDYRVGSAGARGSLVPGRYAITGTLKLVVDNVAVITLLQSGTPTTIDLKWTQAANRLFQLKLGRVFFPKITPPVNDGGPVMVDAAFRAVYDATDTSSFVATTTNDKATTVYA